MQTNLQETDCAVKQWEFFRANRQFQTVTAAGSKTPMLTPEGQEAFWAANPQCRPPMVVTDGSGSPAWKALLDQFIQANRQTHPEYASMPYPNSPYLAILPEGYRAFLATYPQYAGDTWFQQQAAGSIRPVDGSGIINGNYPPGTYPPDLYPNGYSPYTPQQPARSISDDWWKYGTVAAIAAFVGYLISRSSAPRRSTE